jgi:hypothetical protein
MTALRQGPLLPRRVAVTTLFSIIALVLLVRFATVSADQLILRIPKAAPSHTFIKVVPWPSPPDDTTDESLYVRSFYLSSSTNYCVSINGYGFVTSTSTTLPATCTSFASGTTPQETTATTQDCYNIAIASGDSAVAMAGEESSVLSCQNEAVADGVRAMATALGTWSNTATARGEDAQAVIAPTTTNTMATTATSISNVAFANGTRVKGVVNIGSSSSSSRTSNNRAMAVGEDSVATVQASSQSSLAEAGRNSTTDKGNTATVTFGSVDATARAIYGKYNAATASASGSQAIAGGSGQVTDTYTGLGSYNNAMATGVQSIARAGQDDNHVALATAYRAVAQAGHGSNNRASATASNAWAQAWEGSGNTAMATTNQALAMVMYGDYNNVTSSGLQAYASASHGNRHNVEAQGESSLAIAHGGNDHLVRASGTGSIGQCYNGERNAALASAGQALALVVQGNDNTAEATADRATASIVDSASFNRVTASNPDCTVVLENGPGSQTQACA